MAKGKNIQNYGKIWFFLFQNVDLKKQRFSSGFQMPVISKSAVNMWFLLVVLNYIMFVPKSLIIGTEEASPYNNKLLSTASFWSTQSFADDKINKERIEVLWR